VLVESPALPLLRAAAAEKQVNAENAENAEKPDEVAA